MSLVIESGIYSIKNSINGKVYVGSAVNLNERFKVHQRHLRQGKHHSLKLQQAWRKYGEGSFAFTPLLVCEKRDLIYYEQRAIDAFEAVDCGYNMNPTAGSHLGAKQSDECKRKVSIAKRGKKRPPFSAEWRAKMSVAHKGNQRCLGYKHTEEARANMSARVITDEHRAKLSESKKGNSYAKGFKHTAETRAKVSAASKGRKHMLGKKLSEETKRKIGNAHKGKIVSLETRAKMSEAAKQIWIERQNQCH